MWKTLAGVPIRDVLFELRKLAPDARELHIGTDAKRRGAYTDFVTVIALLMPEYGGRVFYPQRTHAAQPLACAPAIP